MSQLQKQVERDSTEGVVRFIRTAREQGIGHETIRQMLLSRGWKNKEICEQIAAVELGQAIPTSQGHGGPREAFYFIAAFACLYVSVVSLVVMLFNLVDIAFLDDEADKYSRDFLYSTVHSALSTLIVFAPLFFVLTGLIRRETRRGMLIAGGAVERWLTYLTLMIIFLTVLIDAANLIYWLLEGELSTSLGLKALTLLVVMATVFVLFRLSNTTSIAVKPPGEQQNPATDQSN